jgi:hypothetical protein
MTRRLEAGPLLVTLGAVLLLVSLFLNWFTGELSAWESFEVWDLVLFVLAFAAIAGGLALATQDDDLIDRRLVPAAAVAIAVIVASQLLDPPPAAAGQDPDTGAWLALAAALVMLVGAVLTFGRVRVALTVEVREPRRRRVSAVDARGPADPTTDNIPVVRPEREPRPGGRLFGRERGAQAAPGSAAAADHPDTAVTEPQTDAPAAGNAPPEPKQE